MLKLRLKRLGRKKQVFYKIVVMENLSKRNAKSLDELGYYDPQKKMVKINESKLKLAFQRGIYPTNTLRHLIYKFKKIQKLNQLANKTEEKKKKRAKTILNKKMKKIKLHFKKNFRAAKKINIGLLKDFRKRFKIEKFPSSFPKEKLTPQKFFLFLKTNSFKISKKKKNSKVEILSLANSKNIQ